MASDNDEQTPQKLAHPENSSLFPEKSPMKGLDWINQVSSLMLISVAAAYLIGFVVVNSYLFSFGMVPYDFLQPRYVSAGLLYLASTVGITSIGLFFRYLIQRRYYATDQVNGEIKYAWTIAFVFMASNSVFQWLLPKGAGLTGWVQLVSVTTFILTFLVLSIRTIISIPKRLSGFSNWWKENIWETGWLSRIILWLMLIHTATSWGWDAFAFYPLFLGALWFLTTGFRPNQKQESVLSENVNGLIYGIGLLGFSIYSYGTGAYPLVSPHVGGGKPLLISVSLKPEHRSIVGRAMGREDSKCIMHNISLIHENTELIYVLPRGYFTEEPAIAIPKSAILSLTYQRKIKEEHSTCFE